MGGLKGVQERLQTKADRMKKSVRHLRVGFGRIDITPSGSFPMGGYIERSGPSIGAHDPLYAKAAAFCCGKTSAVLVAIDILYLSDGWTRNLKKAISREIGVPQKNILVAATHTHSGPAVFAPIAGRANDIVRYEEGLLQDCVEAVRMTFASAEPSRIRAGSLRSDGVASNRRDPTAICDDLLSVVRIEDVSGKARGHLVSFSCHATVMPPSNLEYSADLFGVSARNVEKRFPGSMCIMFNGAAGDSSTRFTRRRQTWAELERLGKKLADQITEAGRDSKPAGTEPIAAKTIRLRFPFRRIPPPEKAQKEYEEALKRVRDAATDPDAGDEARLLARAMVDGAAGQLFISRIGGWAPIFGSSAANVELQAVRVGDLIFCGLPGEFFGRRGAELKKSALPKFGFIAGYANGYCGYAVPAPEASKGGYETLMAPLRSSDEARIVREAKTLIRDVKKRPRPQGANSPRKSVGNV